MDFIRKLADTLLKFQRKRKCWPDEQQGCGELQSSCGEITDVFIISCKVKLTFCLIDNRNDAWWICKKKTQKTLWIWLYALVLIWQIKQTEALLTLQRRCRSSGGSSVKVQLSSGWPLPGSGIKCLFLQRRIQRALSCECRTNPVWMLLPCHCLCVCVCLYFGECVCEMKKKEQGRDDFPTSYDPDFGWLYQAGILIFTLILIKFVWKEQNTDWEKSPSQPEQQTDLSIFMDLRLG